MLLTTLVPILLAATQVSAFGCSTHTFTQCADNIVHWYDPDDGQICDPLDCGGGRAPPKTDVPCCPSYKGTKACVNTPSYLPCFGSIGKSTLLESVAKTTPPVAATTTAQSNKPAETTDAAQSSIASVPGPTSAASGSQGVSDKASATQPPASAATISNTATHSAHSNGTQASTSRLPVQSNNAASGLRHNALAAIAGALIMVV